MSEVNNTEHVTNDPAPPSSDATDAEIERYREDVNTYTAKWVERYDGVKALSALMLWGDFTGDFCPMTIHNLNTKTVIDLRAKLSDHGIFISRGRGVQMKKAILDCLNSEELPVMKETLKETNGNCHVPDTRTQEVPKQSDSNDAEDVVAIKNLNDENEGKNVHQEAKEEPHMRSAHNPNGKALENLTKSFSGRNKYGGNWDEDLLGTIQIYDLTSEMFDLSDENKRRGIVAMLKDTALSYYASHLSHLKSYDEVIDGLKKWFTSDEQRARLLREWQTIRLSDWMQRHPEKSEVSAFRELSAHLSKIQRQLHSDYSGDRFLKDQLVMCANLPSVSRSLKEHPPSTAHEANQRIASLLSTEPNSAGSNQFHGNEAHYGLGQKYHGQAERRYKQSKKPNDHQNRGSIRRKLAKVRGCWVCKEDHLAHKHHTQEEIKDAVSKLKAARAFVSIEDVVEVFHLEEYKADESCDDSSSSEDIVINVAEEVNVLNTNLEARLSDNVFIHSYGYFSRMKTELKNMNDQIRRPEDYESFKGVLIDPGANFMSMMSLEQYRAYCRQFNFPGEISKYPAKGVRGIGGHQSCFGKVLIPIHFTEIGVTINTYFHITKSIVPTLLCLRDLKNTGFDLDIQKDCLRFMGKEEKLEVRNGLLWHNWSENIALFSEQELSRLHRSFGHPSVSALYNLLRRARPKETDYSTKEAIKELTKECSTCATHASKPRRFKLTVGSEDAQFNHTVAADIMYIHNKAVLHVIDEATHFSAACWLKRVTSTEVWRSLLRCWSHMYMGPPDFLRVDQGSNFVSKEFKSLSSTAGITLLEAPVENPNTMSHVERYHGPLRSAFEKLESSLPQEPAADMLQMAVSCVNNTVGPEGLCPTLCVFGAIPNPVRNTPAPNQVNRARAIDEAMKEVQKQQARRKIAFARTYRGPYGKESSELDNLQFGAKVRVYRNKSTKWEGPFTFVSKDGETVCVQLPHGRQIFRSHAVKPCYARTDIALDEQHGEINPVEMNTCHSLYHEETVQESKAQFQKSRKAELEGLLEAGVFELVDRSTVPHGCRVYGTRFVDLLKYGLDGKGKEKSRLVAQNYRDAGAKHLPTKAPTISRMGQRIALSIMAMEPNHDGYSRDITQAYTQGKFSLERSVYLRPVREMGISKDKVLRAVKPLYGIPEAGLHWYLTYHEHHTKQLGMTPSTADPCLLYKRGKKGEIPSLTVLQVDDSLGSGSEQFLDLEEKESRRFLTKPREIIRNGDAIKFNGAQINRTSDLYEITQKNKLQELNEPKTASEAASERAKVQYVASICRPDLASPSQLLASKINNSTCERETLSSLKGLVQYCKETEDFGLKFVKLKQDGMRIVLFTDAAFANGTQSSSQLGFLILLTDIDGNANVLHYGSQKCRRVTRSVMAAELLALVAGFDQAFVVRHTLQEVLGTDIPIDAYVDSRTTFNCVAKTAGTLEKRLQIDASALRESLAKGELRSLGWIPGAENPADGLTRDKVLSDDHPLITLMRTNKVHVKPEGWSDTDPSKVEKE